MKNFFLYATFALGVSAGFLGMVIGEFTEQRRIYNKCMEKNEYTVYVEAKNICKGVVK